MIAVMSMYDRPENAAAHDALWAGIRDGLRSAGQRAPDRLTREGDLAALWRRPDLVLGQACGLPYRSGLYREVVYVGTLDHDLPDTPPGQYHSVIVARRDAAPELAAHDGARLARNDPMSQSGWAAVAHHAAATGITFGAVVDTGAHRASALAVAEGTADIAGLDAVSWLAITRFDPDLAGRLQVIARTAPTPGLPLIAAGGTDPAPLRAAIGRAVAGLEIWHRDTLALRGFVVHDPAAYLAVPPPPIV